MPRKKADRKEVLKAALSVFKEKGYHNATMADVAKACGLLKGSLYHYVSSKEELMAEVLSTIRNHYREKVLAIAYQNELDPLIRLEVMAAECERVFTEEKGGDFMMNIGLETLHVVDRFTQEIRTFYMEWIAALEHLFLIAWSAEEARMKAELAVEQIEGAVLMMQMFERPEFLHRVNRNIILEYKLAIKSINQTK